MFKTTSPASAEPAGRFCPHLTLAAIATPTIWATLLYLLLVR